MTKEQEEAIEKLEYVNRYYDCNNYYSRYELDCIETVLNMLKGKDKEIERLKKENEHWKNKFERELEDNRENTGELLKQDLIIRKKDKQIDLMAEHIQNGCDFDNRIKTKKDIKQYFKSKAEKE